MSVTLRSLDSNDLQTALASEVPSRIEDLTTNPKTGAVEGYVVAAPRFSGNLDTPATGSDYFLQWLSPRGVWLLPVRFQAERALPTGLKVWDITVTGPARREERRRFARVPLDLVTGLRVRRDLTALPVQRRQQAERSGIRAVLAELPETIEARTHNLSEGGMLCVSQGPVLPTHLPLTASFTVNGEAFVIEAYVVWSSPVGDGSIESALTFDESDPQCEVLRPLLWQAQLAARRASLV